MQTNQIWKQYLNVKEIAEVDASIQFEKDGHILDLPVDEVHENYVVVTSGINVSHADYLITAYDLHERKIPELTKIILIKQMKYLLKRLN